MNKSSALIAFFFLGVGGGGVQAKQGTLCNLRLMGNLDVELFVNKTPAMLPRLLSLRLKGLGSCPLANLRNSRNSA